MPFLMQYIADVSQIRRIELKKNSQFSQTNKKIMGKDFQKIKINSKVASTQLALNVFQARKNKIDN